MPDPKRSPSSAAKTLFQTATEMFGGGPLGGDGRSFADGVIERLAAKRSAAEAVKVEPAKPIPIDVKSVVTDNDPAQLERLGVRFGPIEGVPTLSRDEAVALGHGDAYDYAASRPPPYVMRVGLSDEAAMNLSVQFGVPVDDVRALADAMGPAGNLKAVRTELANAVRSNRPIAEVAAAHGRFASMLPPPGACDTLGPAGPGQWLVEGPRYGLPSPGLGDAFKRPPILGDRVYFTPPPNPEAMRAEKRLDAFYPVRPYKTPVVLVADVIRVDAEGTVSLFVKCPVEGPYAVHRVGQAADGVEPGTAEAACLWSWPPARLT